MNVTDRLIIINFTWVLKYTEEKAKSKGFEKKKKKKNAVRINVLKNNAYSYGGRLAIYFFRALLDRKKKRILCD